MRRPATTALLGGVLSVLLLAPLTAVPAAADPDPGPGSVPGSVPDSVPVLPDVVLGERPPLPEETLEEVQELFADGVGGPAADPGETEPGPPVADERDVTLALRDLLAARGDLSRQDRATADAYLARPTDGNGSPFGVRYRVREAAPTCNADVCVHRVDSTADAATPRFARRVLTSVAGVHDTYVAAGYRAPRRDGRARNDGGNAKTDIYLADIGDKAIYGYCTSDPEGPYDGGSARFSTWAYCVLDNDYVRQQYPRNTPQQNLDVTVAHEYFHAVQFAYDLFEDPWLMEGTATWVEDETFDGVDDNVSYLRYGPMGRPARPMDLDRGGQEVYGAWSFWRFLTERFPAKQGGLPTLVRDVWEEADFLNPDETYSLAALQRVLKARGTSVRAQFADYVAANRFSRQRYEEGNANAYPRSPVADQRELTLRRTAYSSTRRLGHLTGSTVRLEPGGGLKSNRWVLRVKADLSAPRRGSELRISVVAPDGTAKTTRVALDRNGKASVRTPFSTRRVQAVEVHLVNASTRIRDCFSLGSVSCQGYARDDRQPAVLRATARAR